MDFPKDNPNKNKKHPTFQSSSSRPPTPKNFYHPKTTNNKGNVKIQQYEYDQQNILGRGFSSIVYLGRLSENARKQFAIKVIDKKKLMGRNRDNLQLLKEEIKIHQQLDHPNIVKCYDIIQKTNFYYLVLEYCPHGTLDGFIKKHEKLTESVAIGIAEQIISGYKYLLGMKVIHRDLKPPNILKSGPNWKICDFGFSLIGKKIFVGELNVGTPAYMAPQSLERTAYSPKTDFFAIGIICYEMLFGSTPWQHKNQRILLQMMKEKKVEEECLSGLKNQNLVDFIMRCCDSNERQRMKLQQFQSFNFWTENSLQPRRPASRARPLSKTLYVQDTNSTNPSQVSNTASSFGSKTTSEKQIQNQDPFKGNTAVIQRQLYYATLIHNLARHHAYMLFEDASEKELFLAILTKHLGHILRRLKMEKTNFLYLKKWKQYSQTQQFKDLKKQIMSLDSAMKELIGSEIKRKTITTIRYVNKKFDDLSFQQQLSSACMKNMQEYLLNLMTKTMERYENVGKAYIVQNSWTSQVLKYLTQYHTYVGESLLKVEQSRLYALKEVEEGERSQILQDFNKSTLRYVDFQALKEQISVLQN